MKYCPKCGNLLDGKLECSCGFVIDKDYVKEESHPIVTDFKTGMMNPSEIIIVNNSQEKSKKDDKQEDLN